MKKIIFCLVVLISVLFSSCTVTNFVETYDLSGYWKDMLFYPIPNEVQNSLINTPSLFLAKNDSKSYNTMQRKSTQNTKSTINLIGNDSFLFKTIVSNEKKPSIIDGKYESYGKILSNDIIHFTFATSTVYENGIPNVIFSNTTDNWMKKTSKAVNTVQNTFKTATLTITNNHEMFLAGEKYQILIEAIPDELFPDYSTNATLTLSSKNKIFKFPLEEINVRNSITGCSEENEKDIEFHVSLLIKASSSIEGLSIQFGKSVITPKSDNFSVKSTNIFEYKGLDNFSTIECALNY